MAGPTARRFIRIWRVASQRRRRKKCMPKHKQKIPVGLPNQISNHPAAAAMVNDCWREHDEDDNGDDDAKVTKILRTTMGAIRSNQSTPTLRLSPRHRTKSVAQQHVSPNPQYALLPSKIHISSTSSAGLLSGLVVYSCLAWIFITLSMNYENDTSGSLISVPLPTSSNANADSVRSSLRHRTSTTTTSTTKQNKQQQQQFLPTNYIQLSSPPNSNSSSTSPSSHPWSWPIIHIVNTRFMQGQGTLTSLARSRLKLLEVVTLPSLMKQSIFDHAILSDIYKETIWEDEIMQLNATYDFDRDRSSISMDPIFLWIIKVDPNLDKTVLDELRLILEPVKHFTIVVGSNTNYGIGTKPGGWRGGEAGSDILNAYDNGRVFFPLSDYDDTDANYYTLRRAHDAREDRIVLETRLDADDAINVDYFWTLQYEALWKLIPDIYIGDAQVDNQTVVADDDDNAEQTARWLYWCPNTHVQWNPSTNDDTSNDNPGTLQVFKMPNVCVTAGLTLGFAVGTKEENVPRYSHTAIYWEITSHHLINGTNNTNQAIESHDIHDCGLYPSSQCAVFVDDPRVGAFRSRAMTSAGMHNIETKGAPSLEPEEEYKRFANKLWERAIEDNFGIDTERAKEAAKFMTANYLGTVRDNLKGQCTHGHSCKVSSLEKLQRTIDILEEEAGGIVVH